MRESQGGNPNGKVLIHDKKQQQNMRNNKYSKYLYLEKCHLTVIEANSSLFT